jgi:hypothetical protein
MDDLALATYETVCSREESAQVDAEIEAAKDTIRSVLEALCADVAALKEERDRLLLQFRAYDSSEKFERERAEAAEALVGRLCRIIRSFLSSDVEFDDGQGDVVMRVDRALLEDARHDLSWALQYYDLDDNGYPIDGN